MSGFRGDLIAAYRRANGRALSQAKLAEILTALAPAVLGRALRVTQQRVHLVEKGLRPDPDMIRLLYAASEGELDANALFGLDEAGLPSNGEQE